MTPQISAKKLKEFHNEDGYSGGMGNILKRSSEVH